MQQDDAELVRLLEISRAFKVQLYDALNDLPVQLDAGLVPCQHSG
jgi:hypothetical protein